MLQWWKKYEKKVEVPSIMIFTQLLTHRVFGLKALLEGLRGYFQINNIYFFAGYKSSCIELEFTVQISILLSELNKNISFECFSMAV